MFYSCSNGDLRTGDEKGGSVLFALFDDRTIGRQSSIDPVVYTGRRR